MGRTIFYAECGAKGEFTGKMFPEPRIKEWYNNLLVKGQQAVQRHRIVKFLTLWEELCIVKNSSTIYLFRHEDYIKYI